MRDPFTLRSRGKRVAVVTGMVLAPALIGCGRIGYAPAGPTDTGVEDHGSIADGSMVDVAPMMDSVDVRMDIGNDIPAMPDDGMAVDVHDVVSDEAAVTDATDGPVDTGGVPNLCNGGTCLRVFVTGLGVPNGAIGGLAEADMLCQTIAQGQALGGTWKAWMSDNTTSAASRLTHATVPYQLLDGTTVANNWTALSGGSLLHAIDMYETGFSRVPSDLRGVWTGTTAAGAASGASCDSWTNGTSARTGTVGDDTLTSGGWTTNGADSCNLTIRRLYCFEQ